MLNTCHDFFLLLVISATAFIHAFLQFFQWTVEMEAEEWGRERKEEGGRLCPVQDECREVALLGASLTHQFQPSEPWAVVTLSLESSLLCAGLGESEHSHLNKYIIWLLWVFQNWKSFHGGFLFSLHDCRYWRCCEPPFLKDCQHCIYETVPYLH